MPRTGVLLLSLVFAPYYAYSQSSAPADLMDLSLEQLMKVEVDSVLGASGYKQKISKAPASITIVTANEIKRYGYRTMADILRNVPGLFVSSDRYSNFVGVRGLNRPGDYNTRFLLLIDGHRFHDTINDGATIGQDFPVDVDLIDRVEVIRGPNSSVYIASAFLGVINVVTLRGSGAKGITLSGEAAGYNTYKSRLSYGARLGSGLDVLLSGSFVDSRGPSQLYFKEFDSPDTNNGIATNADSSRSYQPFVKLSYKGLSLTGAYSWADQHDPTASYGTIFNDSGEDILLRQGFLDLSYEHRFGSDWVYVAHLYYDNEKYDGFYPTDESPLGGPSRVVNQDRSIGQDIGLSWTLSKRLPGEQMFIVGSEYRDNFQQDQLNYDLDPYNSVLNSRRKSTVWGVHVQDQIPLGRNFTLDVGLSYDRYSTFGGTTNPRAGLIYRPLEGTTLKLLYGQSFRAPTAFELYYSVVGEESNPALKPETGKTMELVAEQELPRGFHFTTSAYYYPIRRLITAGSDPATGSLVYENSDRVDLRGAEMTLQRQSRAGLEVSVSLALQYARSLGGSAPLVNSPKVLTQANVSVPFLHGKVYASANLQYVSKRRTLAGILTDAYVVPNFTLYSPRAFLRWEASASLYNAFNDIYGDASSVAHVQDILYQNGRTFRVKLSFHL